MGRRAMQRPDRNSIESVSPERTVSWRDAMLEAAAAARPLGFESVPIAEALGRVTAHDLSTAHDVPHFASSAMDGWAVAGAGPWSVDDSVTGSLAPGHAVAIVTGALIPEGATAVLRSEHAVLEAAPTRSGASDSPASGCGRLRTSDGAKPGEPFPGQHIRLAGEEARAGEVVIAAGTLVNPAHIALAALAARDEIVVVRQPQVRFVFTGDEVDESGLPRPGRVRDTFGPQLPALLQLLGAKALGSRRARDTLTGTVAALEASIHDAQLVITTGGTGHSSADHLRPALRELGASILFDGVNVRPGGPTLLARAGNGCLVACLPGNPLAAMVGLLVTVVPLVRAWSSRASEDLGEVVVGADIAGAAQAALLVPYSIVDGLGLPSAWRGSAMMRGLADAEGLLEVPSGGLVAGERTRAIRVPWR
ncbi:MAG: molybdopterin molybdenumtransferase MoeA [Subtercola sp.]|nr:molybdopterin molybdenumtransferase MoeA [Subtercola sp.]